jgi:hypothetical protein
MNGPARLETSRASLAAFFVARAPSPSGIGQQLSETVHDRSATKGAPIRVRVRHDAGKEHRSSFARRRRNRNRIEKKERASIMKTRTLTGTLVLAALVAAPALAQTNGNGTPTVEGSLSTVPVAPTGLGLQLGGGVTGFSRQGARDRFGTGGYWDVRATLGTDSFIGAELAYVGSARDINATGVTGNAALLGNGAEAVARGNLPLRAGALKVTPFVFGGVGWTYYNIVNSDSNTSSIKDHANALTIPFGAGVGLSYAHLLVDARFTYRAVFDDKLVPTTGSDSQDLQNWSGGLTIGYEL